MNIRRRDIAAVGIATAGLAAAVAAPPARAQGKIDSTWELIKKTSQVRMGVFEYPPYFVRNKTSGEWEGAMVEMGKDIANELKVKFVPVEVGGFAEAVLSLQAGKVDMNFGLQATPIRATAIDFAGPIYWIEWVTVNNPKFAGRNWEDYNKSDVKVAVMTGTSDELLLRKMAPKATRVEFKLMVMWRLVTFALLKQTDSIRKRQSSWLISKARLWATLCAGLTKKATTFTLN